MTGRRAFSSGLLAERLAKLGEIAGTPPARYVIAFSGGLDSTVLSHALSALRDSGRISARIEAIHVDHGLQPESRDWCRHCASGAAAMGIEFQALQVAVPRDSGKGLEAAARDARYAALQAELGDADWLLSAHHRDDQAETLLLNLIRGSGPAGVAGIGEIRRFGPGWLVRPMLNEDRAAIKQYASAANLHWVEDASNTDRRFERNFIRHEVLPVLAARWPDIAVRLQRSASHASEAAQLLIELAAQDFAQLGGQAKRLPIDALSALSPARQRNLIRYAVRELGLPTPTTAQLQNVMSELIPAREDAQPLVAWPGASVRRYRNGLYLMPEKLAPALQSTPVAGVQVDLGAGLGSLRFVRGAGPGLSEALLERGLRIEARVGGEEFQPLGQSHRRKLKKLLQEEGVVPWMRDRLPLVYSGERLVAVADLWLAADAVAEPGVALHWSARPALH